MLKERKIIKEKNQEYLYFGTFPQALKEESITIINKDSNFDNLYLGSDGEKYILFKTSEHLKKSLFNNNKEIKPSKEYYYKVEPIKWKILEKNNDSVLCMSDLILSSNYFGKKCDEYCDSHIREYVINDMYNLAFNDDEKKYVIPYKYDYDLDDVTIPSYDDLNNSNYGYKKGETIDEARLKYMTDYARSRCSYADAKYGYYWLNDELYARYYMSYVDQFGMINQGHVESDFGVVLKIKIKLSD